MKRPRGASLLEVIVAGVLLVTLLGIAARVLAVAASQHRAARQRQTAIQEAGNVMERLAARPWNELTPEGVNDLRLSPETRQALAEGTLTVEVGPAPGEPEGKRIAVAVAWPDRAGQPEQRVRLVAWKYRQGHRFAKPQGATTP